jgi:hypothetical protein
MGPISLVVCCRQMLGFAPTTSLVGSGEKLGTDPRIGQPTCCGLYQSPFSREQWPCSTLLATVRKVATYVDCPQEACAGRTWTGVGSVCVVLVGFSPVWCTSIRIDTTLRYE